MWKLASALALFGALTCASVPLAGSAPAERFDHPSAPHTIKVAAKTVQLDLVDAGDPGFTLGDQVAFSDELRAGDVPGGFVGTQYAAITGGTGRFAGARGQSQVQFIQPRELQIALALQG